MNTPRILWRNKSDDLTEVERVLDEKLRPLMEIEDSADASPDEALADKAA